jgi:hypothetical protein
LRAELGKRISEFIGRRITVRRVDLQKTTESSCDASLRIIPRLIEIGISI